jgi:Putative Actinobacterial Holin-X, holin superfamily III
MWGVRARGGRESESRSLKEASTGELVAEAVNETVLIVRQELALARAELKLKLKRAGFGILLSAGAGLLGLIALLCAVGAAVAALTGLVPAWAAALAVAAGLVILAGAAGLGAVRAFGKASPSTPPDAVASVRADVAEIREHVRHSESDSGSDSGSGDGDGDGRARTDGPSAGGSPGEEGLG